MTIKYIFFDLGDTIIDTSISNEALNFGLKSVLSNKVVTKELISKWAIDSYKTSKFYYKKGEFHTVRRLQEISLKNVLLEYNIDLSVKQIINIVNEFWRYFIKNCILYKDVKPVLSDLVQKKYKLGLITNSDAKNVYKILMRHNLDKIFKIKVISSDFKIYKPNPFLFKHALDLAQCSPQDSIFVDDSMFDIIGAKKIGINTVIINRNNVQDNTTEIKPDFIINNLQEINTIIDKLEI